MTTTTTPTVVWFGVINHRHGTNHYAGATQEAVEKQLADFAREYADHEGVELPKGSDVTDRDCIGTYFDQVEDETYDLVHLDVVLS